MRVIPRGAPGGGAPEQPRVELFGRSVEYKFIVAAVFVSALFLDILDVTIVNVALRTIGEDFRTDSIEWVVLGYTLSLAVWIPASGWFGDRFGTKRVLLTALALFSSARRCAGSPNRSGSSWCSGWCRGSAAGCSPRSAWP
ncbi:MAG: MFS transporter [Ilumatobacteraceae bacterium]